MIHAREDYNRVQDPENKIPQDEPVFLLRAQDETAAHVVRFWAFLNQNSAQHNILNKMALNHADKMDAWPVKKRADLPVHRENVVGP